MAVENALGITGAHAGALPARAGRRNQAHCLAHVLNTAIQAHIIGFKSFFMHVMEVREIVQDIKETGVRQPHEPCGQLHWRREVQY